MHRLRQLWLKPRNFDWNPTKTAATAFLKLRATWGHHSHPGGTIFRLFRADFHLSLVAAALGLTAALTLGRDYSNATPAKGTPTPRVQRPRRQTTQHCKTLVRAFPRKPGPVWKPKPLPRLHREVIVIILKPRVTVALKDVYQHGELGAAFAAYLGTQAAASLSLLPTWEQNLIVAGTRDPHVADKLLRDFQLDSSKGQLLMHGHLKLTGEVCRGVITVATHETKLADIRKLGNSNVAALTFVGKVVPRFVHYNSEVTLVRAYKRTIPACGRCGTVGHRADTCDGHMPGQRQMWPVWPYGADRRRICGQAHATNSRDCTGKFRQLKLPGHKAKRHKPGTTPRPKKPPSHPTPEANGGAPRGAHGADPKTLSPPPLSVTSAHGKKTAPPPPPPSGKDTCHFPALKTDGAAGARASTPQHGKQLDAEYKKQIDVLRAQNELLLNKIHNLESKLAPAAPSPQNSKAMESDAELSPALVATISAMEERLTSKLASMIETAMDQILIKVMTAVPAMISKHIMDNPRLLRRLGPVKDVSRPSKFNCLINESENEDNCPTHSVITPLVAQRAGLKPAQIKPKSAMAVMRSLHPSKGSKLHDVNFVKCKGSAIYRQGMYERF
ncbi:hypothetical protein HPB49_002784 [Dermacentor silvarum]|uniref:Uncharacterized protein n=1 Tax=Dermacentor silvarum TaxID=543639 RepID=A0ACB8CPA7_DERSI|nr:hypothetical protein HPB49_002784 [Dermacentor silvarum]